MLHTLHTHTHYIDLAPGTSSVVYGVCVIFAKLAGWYYLFWRISGWDTSQQQHTRRVCVCALVSSDRANYSHGPLRATLALIYCSWPGKTFSAHNCITTTTRTLLSPCYQRLYLGYSYNNIRRDRNLLVYKCAPGVYTLLNALNLLFIITRFPPGQF